MDKNKSLLIASVAFGFIGLFHLLRAIFSWPASIGSFNIPIYFSYLGFLVAGFLSWMMYKAGK